jgi:hypothetical protein
MSRDTDLDDSRCALPAELTPRTRGRPTPARLTGRTPYECSGTTPEPTARDETACNRDDSTADGIEGNHTRQHERQNDGGSATLPVALGAYEDDFRDAEENCDGEERSAGLREPKPMAEPSPIASQQSHARILGQTNERHPSVSVHK